MERNASFSFPVLLPAVWNVGVMAGAAAASIDPEVTLRMEVLHSGVTRWEKGGPWSCIVSCQPFTFTKEEKNFLLLLLKPLVCCLSVATKPIPN